MREVTVALWLDLRNKKNYVRLNIKELKDKQKVTADGELFIPIGADSDLWALLEQQKYSGDAALYFTVCDIVTDCQNKLDIVYNEVGQRNKHIFRAETKNTYTYIPSQTKATGYFADAEGNVLKRVIDYNTTAYMIVNLINGRKNGLDKYQFTYLINENRPGEDRSVERNRFKPDANGCLKKELPLLGLYGESTHKRDMKHDFRPRLFYFIIYREDKDAKWFPNKTDLCIYPTDYKKDGDNDVYLHIDIQKHTTAEDIKKDKEFKEEQELNIGNIYDTTPRFGVKVYTAPKKPVSFSVVPVKDKTSQELADERNKQIDKKNKEAFPNIESTLGRNYSLQLKVAKDTGINQSLEKISPVIIGEGKISKKNGKCECRDLIWGNKLSCDERKKVIEVCSNIWGEDQKKEKANMLMAVMHLETMATFNPSIENGKGYVGLVQFHSSTAEGLGTTYDALKKMTFIEQMIYVEKYLKQNKDKMNTLVDFYLQVVKPNAVGNGNNPNYIVFDESIEVPDGDGSKTSSEQRKKNITREPWVTKYGYASNPPFMKEEGEYTKRRKWVYTRQQYEERYGFHNGKTYIWEIEKAINAEHYQAGIAQKYTGQCINEPKEDKKIEVVGDRTPWMETVLKEAANYGGILEDKIDDRITQYHKEGANIDAGSGTAWCASFASWCLLQKDYPNPASPASRSFMGKSMEKVDVFFGAIVVFSDCDSKGNSKFSGHVSFVYGKLQQENFYACLGGNQSDMLKVSSYDCSGKVFVSYRKKGVPFYKYCRGFYKPVGYVVTETDLLTMSDEYKTISEANERVINLKLEMNKNGESSR